MTVMEVVKLAAENLGRLDLSDSLDALEGEPEGELKSLLRCFNLVENEIALDHFPLKKEETFSPVNHLVSYRLFAKSPVDVLQVTNEKGEDVEFDIRTEQLYIPGDDETVNVVYAYVPNQKSLSDESDFSGKISARLISFGVAGEFCFTASRFQEAALWERRFLDALKAANISRKKTVEKSDGEDSEKDKPNGENPDKEKPDDEKPDDEKPGTEKLGIYTMRSRRWV